MSNAVRLAEPTRRFNQSSHADSTDTVKAEQAALLALIAEVLEANSAANSLDALASSVQHHLGCYRVAIALAEDDGLKLCATSKQAFVDKTSTESTLITDAMQEACDREVVVRWPLASARDTRQLGVLVAHRALAGRRRSVSYCSVPVFDDQQLVAAMLLERRDGYLFTEQQSVFLERIASIVAPLLTMRLRTERNILSICVERINTTVTRQFGVDRPSRVVIAGLSCLGLLGALLLPVKSHIGATAELVPLERRLVTAPRAGFVQSIDVVAGEQVDAGQLLATLDARDLELEASRAASAIATAEVEFRAAMASFDRQASAVARARLAQYRAQQRLAERQLEQNRLVAPIAGLVLTSDPGNTHGAPVSRGDTLFEIAPAEGFEVHLLIDESDIRDIAVGQPGELSLRARPDESLALTIQSVHPIAEAGNGSTVFRVRASLDDNSEDKASMLRPGESGQARLDAGTSTLVRILLGPLWERLLELKWRLFG